MYVALEGIDTVGKSTQIEALAKIFTQAVFTKEPGGTRFGSMIREVILHGEYSLCSVAELFLFLADRAEHFHQVIKPHVQGLVISDRSLISGMAYAIDVEMETLATLNLLALDSCLPDVVVLLETDKDTLTSRLLNKHGGDWDHIERRGIDYLLSVQERMKRVIEYMALPALILPSNAPVEYLTQQIAQKIKAHIGKIN